jgi:hypothetical protein
MGGGVSRPPCSPYFERGCESPHLQLLDGRGREPPPLQPLDGWGHEQPPLQPLDGRGREPPPFLLHRRRGLVLLLLLPHTPPTSQPTN